MTPLSSPLFARPALLPTSSEQLLAQTKQDRMAMSTQMSFDDQTVNRQNKGDMMYSSPPTQPQTVATAANLPSNLQQIRQPTSVPQMQPSQNMKRNPASGDPQQDMLRQYALKFMQFGNAQQKIMGLRMLRQASQPRQLSRQEIQNQEIQRNVQIIEQAGLDKETKQRAMTVAMLGGDAKQLQTVMGLDATGLKQSREVKDLARANRTKNRARLVETTTALNEIERAIPLVGSGTTGIAGYMGSFIPGTDANQLNRLIDPVKAILGFDKLQQIRESSPTGGALGQVSNYELRFLQAVAGSLNIDQQPRYLRENLVRIRDMLKYTTRMRGLAEKIDYGTPEEQTIAQVQYDELLPQFVERMNKTVRGTVPLKQNKEIESRYEEQLR